MAPKAKWTILTYIAAHNNLHCLGKSSYDEITGVGSTPAVMQGVLFDGQKGAARYMLGDPGKVLRQEPLHDYDSGDPDRLNETARWVFGQYPAERYGLILWSHGSGWRPEEIEQVAKQARRDTQVDAQESKERAASTGSRVLFRSTLKTIMKKDKPAERAICFDDGSGHSLDTLELERVTSEIQRAIGQPLDFLGMDACLMANLEVAYQLRNSVRYMVASEELVPGHSWPYKLIFTDLRADPDQSAGNLSASVVKHYTQYYTAHPPESGDVTKVALDLSNISKLAQAADRLARALKAEMDSQADFLWNAQGTARDQESIGQKRKPNKFSYHLWDIRSVSARLAQEASSGTVREAAQTMADVLLPEGPVVRAEGHYGSWFDGIGGVSIYLVQPTLERISPYYPSLALSIDTQWDEMLAAFHAHYPLF